MPTKNDDVMIGTYVSSDVSELLECIAVVSKGSSKAKILRDALMYYLDNVISREVLSAARKVMKIRFATPNDRED